MLGTNIGKFIDRNNEKIMMTLKPAKERKITHHLYLTNRKVIKYVKTKKQRSYKDIPLEHITSIEYDSSRIKIFRLILGIIGLIIGFAVFFIGLDCYWFSASIMIPLGLVCMLISFYVVVKALAKRSTLRIFSYDERALISYNFKKTALNTKVETFISIIHWLREAKISGIEQGETETKVNELVEVALEQQGVDPNTFFDTDDVEDDEDDFWS
ncbi:MAG: hypothetical protein GF364_16195 [Candidatus Lokiarchaeota archaeon]|nr:hypothetical protein [Candidatus Lokiarchaeota archaeon]